MQLRDKKNKIMINTGGDKKNRDGTKRKSEIIEFYNWSKARWIKFSVNARQKDQLKKAPCIS